VAKYLVLALNGPVEGDGQEETYNRWYDEVHLPELRAVPGIVKATRYKVVQSNQPWPYVATYQIETDDLQATMAAMQAGMGPFDPSFKREGSGNLLAIALGD
jgi:hypothetical protein